MADRLFGVLLFLPVPLVLWLFTRMPLGTIPSLAAGALLMLTHPLYARPFALSRAGRRCLWCGVALTGGEETLEVREPRGLTRWRACGPRHLDPLQRVLGWASRQSAGLRAGVLGTLALFLLSAAAADRRQLGPIEVEDTIAFFRLGIALTVLPLGWGAPHAARPAASAAAHAPIRTPFPLHLQALIGTLPVLWLFRLVGLVWLAQGLRHLAGRFPF